MVLLLPRDMIQHMLKKLLQLRCEAWFIFLIKLLVEDELDKNALSFLLEFPMSVVLHCQCLIAATRQDSSDKEGARSSNLFDISELLLTGFLVESREEALRSRGVVSHPRWTVQCLQLGFEIRCDAIKSHLSHLLLLIIH